MIYIHVKVNQNLINCIKYIDKISQIIKMSKRKKQIAFYSEIVARDNCLAVHDYPEELYEMGFKKVCCGNRKWAQYSNLGNYIKVEICYGVDFYGGILIPDDVRTIDTVYFEGTDMFEKFEKFKWLISKDRINKLKQEALDKKKKCIDSMIFGLTEKYVGLLFDDTSCLDTRKMAKSAKQSIINQLYTYYHNILDEDGFNIDELDDDLVYDWGLGYSLFYDYYPGLNSFASHVSGLMKGEYPNGDCLCGSEVETWSMEYNTDLLKYANQLVINNDHKSLTDVE